MLKIIGGMPLTEDWSARTLSDEPSSPSHSSRNKRVKSSSGKSEEAQSVKLLRLRTSVLGSLADIDGHDGQLQDHYTLGAVLGSGAFGVVREAISLASGEKFVCKSIPKEALTQETITDIKLEAEIMVHLRGHPNIVEFMGMFQDEAHVHIVEEYCGGGDLYSKLTSTPMPYTEKDAAAIMRTVLQILDHCHAMGVLYRDCKPDNFLLSSDGPDAVLKAADFGISRFIKPGETLEEFCGTPSYMAPEVFNCSYSFPADVWSAGVMMFWVLCGEFPFKGRNKIELARKVVSEQPYLEGGVWDQITADAKDCLRQMLIKDPAKRPAPAVLLQHRWFQVMSGSKAKPLGNVVLERMRNFSKMNPFKQEVLLAITRHLEPAYLVGIKTMFESIDTRKSGKLTAEEILAALAKQRAQVDLEEVRVLIGSVDEDHDGKIDFTEFAACTIHSSLLERKELLQKAFDEFDRDCDGAISKSEMEAALRDTRGLGDKRVAKVLHLVEKQLHGKMSFDDFSLMVLENEQHGKSLLKTFKLRWPLRKSTGDGIFSDRKSLGMMPNLQVLSRPHSPVQSPNKQGANRIDSRRSSVAGFPAADKTSSTQHSQQSQGVLGFLGGRGRSRRASLQVLVHGNSTSALEVEDTRSNQRSQQSELNRLETLESHGFTAFFSRLQESQSGMSRSSSGAGLSTSMARSPSAVVPGLLLPASSTELGLSTQQSFVQDSSPRPSCLRHSSMLGGTQHESSGPSSPRGKRSPRHISWVNGDHNVMTGPPSLSKLSGSARRSTFSSSTHLASVMSDGQHSSGDVAVTVGISATDKNTRGDDATVQTSVTQQPAGQTDTNCEPSTTPFSNPDLQAASLSVYLPAPEPHEHEEYSQVTDGVRDDHLTTSADVAQVQLAFPKPPSINVQNAPGKPSSNRQIPNNGALPSVHVRDPDCITPPALSHDSACSHVAGFPIVASSTLTAASPTASAVTHNSNSSLQSHVSKMRSPHSKGDMASRQEQSLKSQKKKMQGTTSMFEGFSQAIRHAFHSIKSKHSLLRK